MLRRDHPPVTIPTTPPPTQAPLGPAAGGAGYALKLQGQQCMEVVSPPLEDTGELAVGVWVNPLQVKALEIYNCIKLTWFIPCQMANSILVGIRSPAITNVKARRATLGP